MGAEGLTETVEITVSYSVTVCVVANDDGLTVNDFFEHEIRDAMTPDATVLDALLEDAGLPIAVVDTCSI